MLGALVEEVRCQTENDDCEDELRSAQDDGEEAREDHSDGCWTWSRRSVSGVAGMTAAECSAVWRK